jgi:hypothetical protein
MAHPYNRNITKLVNIIRLVYIPLEKVHNRLDVVV